MDRALRAEDLADALGSGHPDGALPTVEELIDLIAQVEVGAFSGPDEVDFQLVETAWYLHAIASAANAEHLYTPVRQQRAFRVSAHIFDLALNGPSRTDLERLTFAFAAQVGYRRSDLDPNATAIWRRVDADLVDVDDEIDQVGDMPVPDTIQSNLSAGRTFSLMAIRAGVAFLGLDFNRVSELLIDWKEQIARTRALLEMDTLLSTMFGPGEQVVIAVEDLVAFLRYGDISRLDTARAALQSVVDLTAGEGDHDARWVAAHLLAIADGMETSSIWSILPPGSPDELAQSFTIGSPPVLTLWPPQRDLLRRTEMNPLDPETKRLLLSVPTSAGKTLLAQIIICHHLATGIGDVCYVTPLRSLGREMRQALASRLRILQKGLGDDLPDFASTDLSELLQFFWSGGNRVEVMTPERLAHMLRRDPDGVLSRFSMFVIDEAHLVAQPGRGFLLESLLGLLSTTEARLILLSGVMGNAQQIAAWLDESSDKVLFTSSWRGPRRLHAILNSTIVWSTERMSITRSKTHPVRKDFDVVGTFRIKPAEAGVSELPTSQDEPIGVKRFEYSADGKSWRHGSGGSTPFYKMCATAAASLLHAGSLLMIVSRRDYARGAAETLASMLPESNRTGDLVDLLVERIGEEHPLVGCVRKGVGYHHAGLPLDVLGALEQAIRSEILVALIATTTLTDGVNLPVRTVLISETRFPTQDPAQHLDAARLLNAVGRAGRAGRESEGWIVLALQRPPKGTDFNQLRPADEDLEIHSTLMSERAVEQLAEAEALLAESADALFELANSATADFASFLWFVFSAQQRLDQMSTGKDIVQAVHRLLGFAQMPEELANRWLAFAQRVLDVYEQTTPESRQRWMATGTSIGSARQLEALAATVAEHAQMAYPGATFDGTHQILSVDETLKILTSANCFDALLALPECGKVWRFKPTPGGAKTLDVPVTPALKAWMSGFDMPALAAVLLPNVTNAAWRLEQTVDAVSGAFEHYFSWTVGAVIEQANERLEGTESATRLSHDLPHMIRYGVDTLQAVGLLGRGVQSRRLAYVVGKRAADSGKDLQETLAWLRHLHIQGWIEEFDASPREIDDLSDVTRESSTSLIRQFLSSSQATAQLHTPLTPTPQLPIAIELRIIEPHLPIEVWALGESSYRVGMVAASDHSDVIALSAAGLTFAAHTDGNNVTIRADG
ncbi:DEAD/DEAH box helicase [Mycolicibacterium sp.]|uniref:DEAD/DEAH box helicase n=1 Tax=Mycolicibacterium sp. TaxID=2320850 RepID=UPI0037C5200E